MVSKSLKIPSLTDSVNPMKALTLIPKVPYSLTLQDVNEPPSNPNQVLVRVLDAGLCRTDIEIMQGLYGETPQDSPYLILGHESLGIVEQIDPELSISQTTLQKNDYVVRLVRRPCLDTCLNCQHGQNDMCLTGNYTETGIKGINGNMAQYYSEDPHYLIKVPQSLRHIGVLVEPLSFVEKAIYQIYKVQERMHWQPKTAVVLGAGPIGILATMILQSKGVNTHTLSRSKPQNKSEIIHSTGASLELLADAYTRLEKKADIVIEATGNAALLPHAMNFLNTNGVLCLTSVTGDNQKVQMPISQINIDFVLGNKIMVGVVNANREDYHRSVERLLQFESQWPGLTSQLITKKVHYAEYKKVFDNLTGIKNVIQFSE